MVALPHSPSVLPADDRPTIPIKTRPLTQDERAHLDRLVRRGRIARHRRPGDGARVAFVHQRRLTVAYLRLSAEEVAVGVAARNPIDANNPEVGERLALVRAARSRVRVMMPTSGRVEAVTEKDGTRAGGAS